MIPHADTCDRPRGLNLATALIVLQSAVACIGFTPVFPFGTLGAIIVSITTPYFFWRGKNWARIVVICIAVGSLLLLLIDLPKHDPLRTLRNIVNSVLASFFLYYLNTPSVRSYFNRPSGRTII